MHKKYSYMLRLSLLSAFLLSSALSFSQTKATSLTKGYDWHHLDPVQDTVFGVSSNRAYSTVNLNPKAALITVAVIDGDLDVNHEDLKNRLWTLDSSTKTKYEGVINGWNFLGTSDGKLVRKVGSEAFREYKRLRPKYKGKSKDDFRKKKDRAEYEYFLRVKRDAKINSYLNFFPLIELTNEAYELTDSLLKQSDRYKPDIKLSEIQDFKVQDSVSQENVDAALRSSFRYSADTEWSKIFKNQQEEYSLAVKRIESLDNTSNPRDSIGDNLNRLSDRYYGNPILVDSTSYHGTFVAGLIAGERENNIGIDGIAESARIMGIRAVPDGDEFDKDIALAIDFAVNHGARIINMSFGKKYSPNSKWVTKSMRRAIKRNVLIVQAAGNDNSNIDSVSIYPEPTKNRDKNAHLIVAASTPNGSKASFSNFGIESVDFFAPGKGIVSTALGDEYAKANGTSFSAPIVSGIAALVWSEYPHLKAYEVADILRESAAQNQVEDLEGLAIIPGVVNAYNALKIAKDYVSKK